ncbi:hypothetical protein PFMC_06006, partial [Plasmodium falciparum CAMP/Malaysia]
MAAAGGGGAGSGGGNDYSKATDAKHLFDMIGKDVHDQVKKDDAETYKDELKAGVSFASIFDTETTGTADTCELVKQYYNKPVYGNSNRYPCKKDEKGNYVDRFSVKQGAECSKSKIKDSKNYCGACAPYRRLHLCDYNLETINNTTSMTHKLLLEVCMAAKYEGESLERYHDRYKVKYPDSHYEICTELARSFADIGDIVRGRDLYRGGGRGRKQLDDSLKKIFGKIHDDVTTNGKKSAEELKKRYQKDRDNYFQLREDWWTANRHTVWEALTCDARDNAEYFRKTPCAGKTATEAIHKCRCSDKSKAIKANDNVNIVPTYFDYVPQFLRWFEEWAEDFCRKRKHKLENAIKICRGQDGTGKERYCDLNRHDCKKTASGEQKFGQDDDCIGCHYSCSHFVKWIDKQKVEFDKQKKKYTSEISGGSGRSRKRKKRDARSTGSSSNYDGYESKFYKILKKDYKDVKHFLEKLSKEGICQSQPTVGNEIADAADFTDEKYLETFSHTKYCRACPWCGVKEQNGEGGKWEPKGDGECGEGKDYKNYNKTEIPILTPQEQPDIFQKYKKFCDRVKDNENGGKGGSGGGGRGGGGDGSGREGDGGAANSTTPGTVNGGKGGSGAAGGVGKSVAAKGGGGKGENGASGKNGDNITETWKCYYKKNENNDVKKDINFCVLQDGNQGKPQEKSMHYNSFFWDWVYHMLHDSVEWRKQLGRCINKDNGNTCKNSCKRPCECFAKWVVKKKEEWGKIIEHFYKQENIPGNCYFITLEGVLDKEVLLKSIQDVHANAEDIEHIKQLLDEEEKKNQEEAAATDAIAGGGFGGFGAFGTSGDGFTCSDSDNKKETIMDKLIEHEERIATECKETHNEDKCKEQEQRSRARSDSHEPTPSPPDGHDENADEEDDDDDDDDDDEESEEPVKEDPEEAQQEEESSSPEDAVPPATTQDNAEKPCDIVDKLFTTTNALQEACKQKYDGKYYGWKCISETTTTSGATTGGLCIPPRRRRLYVGKLHDWAEKTQLQTQ